MTGKPIPIDLVPFAEMLDGSREFLRVWAKPDGAVTVSRKLPKLSQYRRADDVADAVNQ